MIGSGRPKKVNPINIYNFNKSIKEKEKKVLDYYKRISSRDQPKPIQIIKKRTKKNIKMLAETKNIDEIKKDKKAEKDEKIIEKVKEEKRTKKMVIMD
jgi:hypothetical protein